MSFDPPLRLLAAYQQQTDKSPGLVVQVPGREMWVAADIGDSHIYTIIAPDIEGRVMFDRRSARQKRTVRNRPLPRWARYLAGVVQILTDDDDMDLPGGTVVIVGDEPPGPRYEHALGIAFAALWHDYLTMPYDLTALLEVVDRVQKQYLD